LHRSPSVLSSFRSLVLFAACTAPLACSSVTENVVADSGGSSSSGGNAGAGVGGAPNGGAPNGGAPDGGAPDGGAPNGGAPNGGAPNDAATDPCASTQGPKMVAVDGYCVDGTEVSRADYAAFLAAKPKPPVTVECSFKTSYTPSCESPGTDPALPVVCVDVCDAEAYCAFAGKRLCGRIGGGNVASGFGDPAVSQWFNACSQGGTRVYPYGKSYAAKACNGYDFGAGAPVSVGVMSGCVGGFDGIFDMSGNVREWEEACDASQGPDDVCRNRGGSFTLIDKDYLGCASAFSAKRSTRDPTIGFRCCRD